MSSATAADGGALRRRCCTGSPTPALWVGGHALAFPREQRVSRSTSSTSAARKISFPLRHARSVDLPCFKPAFHLISHRRLPSRRSTWASGSPELRLRSAVGFSCLLVLSRFTVLIYRPFPSNGHQRLRLFKDFIPGGRPSSSARLVFLGRPPVPRCPLQLRGLRKARERGGPVDVVPKKDVPSRSFRAPSRRVNPLTRCRSFGILVCCRPQDSRARLASLGSHHRLLRPTSRPGAAAHSREVHVRRRFPSSSPLVTIGSGLDDRLGSRAFAVASSGRALVPCSRPSTASFARPVSVNTMVVGRALRRGPSSLFALNLRGGSNASAPSR